MIDWKTMAFRDIVDEEFQDSSMMNVISVGDAEYEYQALISLYKKDKINYKLLKSIRFMKTPTHDSLIDQLSVLKNVIPHICSKIPALAFVQLLCRLQKF